MSLLNNKKLVAYAVWDTDKQEYMGGYKHSLSIALFMTVKGAKSSITHYLKYAYNTPNKGKKFSEQTRFQIRELIISDVGLISNE
jgi:hypothetical protein